MNRLILFISISLVVFNCHSTSTIKKMNGMTTPRGNKFYYQSTNIVALHLFGVYPLWKNAKLDNAIHLFTQEAVQNGGKKINLIQKDQTRWYLLYPPISFVITPVTTEVFGEIYSK